MLASPRNFPAGDIRVSDAERDRALAELSEHFQAGRLTREEFDERSGNALRAGTGRELTALFADLPPTGIAPAPAPSGMPSRACLRWPAPRIVIACVIAAIVVGNVAGNVGHGVNHASFGWLVPVVVLLIVFRRLGRR
jgi:hypothetical protein